jgi:hypothetical protein
MCYSQAGWQYMVISTSIFAPCQYWLTNTAHYLNIGHMHVCHYEELGDNAVCGSYQLGLNHIDLSCASSSGAALTLTISEETCCKC